jgi:two-component system OmpR family sensor kinase
MAAKPLRAIASAARSLRWRLAASVAILLLLITALTFAVVYRGTGTQLRREIDSEIKGDTGALAHAVTASRARTPRGVAAAARAYIQNQPFSASSTLLFALVPGVAPSTNQPELFGPQQPDEGESAAEQALENRQSQRLRQVGAGFSTLVLPDIGDLRLLEHRLFVHPAVRGARAIPVTVGVGEPLASVARAQRGVAKAFVLAGLLALAGGLLASLLIGTRLSRPLRRMATVAAQVDGGDLYPRIHDVDRGGEEVRILAAAFNHMLDRLTDAFAAQRAFVADASHELRTPLTVIRGQLEVLAAQRHPAEAEVRRVEGLVQAEIARITRLVDDLLLLARAEQPQFLRPAPVDVRGFVEQLWDALGLLGAQRRFELGPLPSGVLIADPDRLAQALRNLLTNAIAHTAAPSGLVRLDLDQPAPGRLRFAVQDDGPGIPNDQRERIFDRFHRTDSARDRASGGTGLGLAIVRAIATAHGGRVSAGAAATGGARVELELPGFSPAGGATAQPAARQPATPRRPAAPAGR